MRKAYFRYFCASTGFIALSATVIATKMALIAIPLPANFDRASVRVRKMHISKPHIVVVSEYCTFGSDKERGSRILPNE